MPVTADIVASYRGPARVMRRLLAMGRREERALAILMAGCVLVFVGQMPRLARQAHLTGEDLDMLMGATLLAWVVIAPLMLYVLAALSQQTNFSVGCYCADEARCHRSILRALLGERGQRLKALVLDGPGETPVQALLEAMARP